MHKKFEINRTKIKGGCQSGRKVVTYNSESDLPLHNCKWYIEKKWIIYIHPVEAIRSGLFSYPMVIVVAIKAEW